MEDRWRWQVLTAIAPISWGATYFVTREFLPADTPIWGTALRALPAAALLMILVRRRPHGAWWARSLLLGMLNVGAFFLLVYVSAQLLPTSIASSVMALAPLALAASAWALLGQRPTVFLAVGAAAGIAGAMLLVWRGPADVDPRGLVAAAGALALSSVGAILTRRWADGTPLLVTTAWQVTAGALMLTTAAVIAEGAPPELSPPQLGAIGFVSLVATAAAYVCWFGGIARLPAGLVGTIGLLNPVTGVLLGTTLGGESLSAPQLGGVALVLAGIALAARRPRARGVIPRGRTSRARGRRPRPGRRR